MPLVAPACVDDRERSMRKDLTRRCSDLVCNRLHEGGDHLPCDETVTGEEGRISNPLDGLLIGER